MKIILELEFGKLNLGIGILKIKFEKNWSFENQIKELKFRKIFENRNFGRLYENRSFKI